MSTETGPCTWKGPGLFPEKQPVHCFASPDATAALCGWVGPRSMHAAEPHEVQCVQCAHLAYWPAAASPPAGPHLVAAPLARLSLACSDLTSRAYNGTTGEALLYPLAELLTAMDNVREMLALRYPNLLRKLNPPT